MQQPKPHPAEVAAGGDATGPSDAHTDTARPDAAAPLRLEAGAEPVQDYRLVQFLGRGGYGEVWKARGPGGHAVALKFIALGDQSGAAEERAAELLKARDVRHPNLLGLFGSWRRDDRLILALELADCTLMDRLNEAVQQGLPGVPLDELMEYMREAAKGLDHLHSVGVQHRDVKPQNLLLVGGGLKVADFGLAKVLEQTGATNTGALTPAYAAPELLKGRVSTHSDQYSLAVAYCVLRGGRPLFSGGPAQVMMGHLCETPDLTALPEAEQRVALRALAKEPNDRWPSCRDFVEALAVAAAAPVVADSAPPRPTVSVKSRRPATGAGRPARRRLALILAAVLLLAVAVAAGVLLWMEGKPPRGVDPAHGAGADLAGLTRQDAKPVTTNDDGASQNQQETNSDDGVQAAVRGAIRKGREHLTRNEWGLARASFGAAIELDPNNAEAYACRAKADDNAHRLDDALADSDKAIALDPNSALAHAYRCEVYADKGDMDKAITEGDRAVALDAKLPVARRSRGYVYAAKGDQVAALRDFDEAIRLDPNYTEPYIDRGKTRLAAGADDDALEDFNRAVVLAPQSSGGYVGRSAYYVKREQWDLAVDALNGAVQAAPKDPDALLARGQFRQMREDRDGAVADFRAAVRLAPKLSDPHTFLARLYADKGDADRAVEEYSEAIDLGARNTANLDERAWQRYAKGDYDAALKDFGDAIGLDPKDADAFKGRGFTNHRLGNADAALDDLNQAIRLNPKDDGLFNERGVIRYEQGDNDKAIADYSEAIKLSPNDPVIYDNRANAYEQKGDSKKAEADRKKAEKLKSGLK